MILFASLGIALISLMLFLKPAGTVIFELFLLSLAGSDIYYVLFWDFFSWLFVFIVLIISSMIFAYSSYYMDNDSARLGFIMLLLSFVISMVFLLVSPNLISMLLGWDGLGVTSYVLVLYYSSSSSSVAGTLTFLTNRLGDIFFLFSIGVMLFFYDWENVFNSFFLLGGFITLAAFTKSAQVPFSSWLPAAMAAPTPVSSLVHSSTLVTAGVFLMVRFSFLMEKIMILLFLMGSVTLLVAGLMANLEWDLKKLIAFSTLSQLGFMVSSFGLGLVWMSFFHLITHALFKASLFLCAGILIHNSDNSQEFRNMSVVPSQLFWVVSVINICLFCLCGIPFTSGFYSKDLIVDGGQVFLLFFGLYLVGVLLTLGYSLRFFTFSHKSISMRSSFLFTYEKVYFVLIPLSVLLVLALLGGSFFFDMFFSFLFLGMSSSGWKSVYFFLLLGAFLFVNKNTSSWKNNYLKLFFFSSLWFLKFFFSSKGLSGVFKSGKNVFKGVDQGVLEYLGPQGVYSFFSSVAFFFSFQSMVVFIFLIGFMSAFIVL